MSSNIPLPYGWISQIDPNSGHPYYVDTKASPPRSIWTHPYEDELYLSQHPEVRDKVRGSNRFGSDASLAAPPPSLPQRRSFGGRPTTPTPVPPPPHKKGFLSKLKEKALNSLEERNQRRLQPMSGYAQQSMPMYPNQGYAPPQYAYPQRPQYMAMGSGMAAPRRRGMGGMALPFLGGLAGGMLLDDVMDHHDGDWGGGPGGWDDGGWGDGGGWDGGGGDWGGGGFGF